MAKVTPKSHQKVLITGGAGFIGYHLGKALAEEGYQVTLCDNLFRGTVDEGLRLLCDMENVHFLSVDLTDKRQLKKLGGGYRQVYHLAAINGTRYFYEIPHEVLRVNLLTTINILEWAAKSKNVGRLLLASSSETYGGTARAFSIPTPTPEDVPLTIDDEFNPRLSYAGSKIACELLFINYAKAYNLDTVIVRYHNIYGPRMGYEHVIPEFIERLSKGENPFKIFGPEQTRAFCYIDDAVRATRLVMETPEAKGQVLNIGNDKEEITILNLARRVFNLVGVHPREEPQPAPRGSVSRRCPNISKLKRLTSYEPRVSLREGLEIIYQWYKGRVPHLQIRANEQEYPTRS